MTTPLKIIISGGPSTGKSTILQILQQNGYKCFDEVAREVIKNQLAINSNLVPWLELEKYSNLVFEKLIEQAAEADRFELSFLDRSAVDVIAYLKHGGCPIPEHMDLNKYNLGYCKTVFFTPFWSEIYKQDSERKELVEDAKLLSECLYNTYIEKGFTVVEVPKVEPIERVRFIQNCLANMSI